MQIVETQYPPGTVTVIGPSLATDLSWASHAVWSPRLRSQHPMLGTLLDEHPELFDALHGFWEDGTECYPELQVLAHVAGAIEETDFERLFDAMASARAEVPADLPLRSESPANGSPSSTAWPGSATTTGCGPRTANCSARCTSRSTRGGEARGCGRSSRRWSRRATSSPAVRNGPGWSR